MHGLEEGHFIVFAYDGEAVLTVKICDGTLCHRHYNEEAMRDLSAFEFVIPIHQPPGEMLRLPEKFGDVLAQGLLATAPAGGKRRDAKLGCGGPLQLRIQRVSHRGVEGLRQQARPRGGELPSLLLTMEWPC